MSPPYSLLLESIYLATPSGFEENYSYKFMGFAIELNGMTATPGPTGRFFIMDPRNQKVALARAAGDGAYNLKVAKGMDASLVAVVYLMSELLKDETIFQDETYTRVKVIEVCERRIALCTRMVVDATLRQVATASRLRARSARMGLGRSWSFSK